MRYPLYLRGLSTPYLLNVLRNEPTHGVVVDGGVEVHGRKLYFADSVDLALGTTVLVSIEYESRWCRDIFCQIT